MFAKVLAGLIVAAGLFLGVHAYGLAAQLQDTKYDPNFEIGHTHRLNYNYTTCYGGEWSGHTVYQPYQIQSQWKRQAYHGGLLAKIDVANRNTGQTGRTCSNQYYNEHYGVEHLHPVFRYWSGGYNYTYWYTKNLTGWHYLLQATDYDVGGTCLYTHHTDYYGNPVTGVQLKSQLKPSPTGTKTNCS